MISVKIFLVFSGLLGLTGCGQEFVPESPAFTAANCEVPQKKIPRIIHQVWHDWSGKTPNPPKHFLQFREELKRLHPESEGWTHILWSADNSLAFLKENYPEFVEMYKNYDKPVKRSDAIRYFILHHFGGIYLDMGFQPLKNIGPLVENGSGVLFQQTDYPEDVSNFFCNGALAFSPKHPFIEGVIKSLESHKSLHVLEATGPALITKKMNSYSEMCPNKVMSHPTKTLFPFNWREKNGEHSQKCLNSPEECKVLFPDSYLVNHWKGSWI